MKQIFFIISFLIVINTLNAQTSIVKVKIEDESNLNLPLASVQLVGKKSTVFSDASGNAIIYGVAYGKQRIKVTYVGYEEVTKEINVIANITEVSIQLISGVKTLNAITVLGDRLKGQAKALNQQKNGGTVANIISADQIGRFPDANIGDALKRVPGVAMQNDQGEARDIIIRGLAPQLNSVTLNGDRIPSAEGDNRRIQMDLIPSDMIQTVAVNKTLTPDLEGDAIGGSVNLVTRKAPNKLRISGTLSGGTNPIRGKALYTGSLVIGNRSKNKAAGFVGSMNINDNIYGSDNVEAVWATAANGAVFLSQHDIRKYDVQRRRMSFNLSSDFKLNKKNTLYISGMYNQRNDWENRFRLRTRSIVPLDAAGAAVTLPTQTIASYRGEIRKETKGGINNDVVKNTRLERQIVTNLKANGEHIIGKNVLVDWSTAMSRASEERPNERYIDFRVNNVILKQDISNPEQPSVNLVTRRNASAYSFRRLSEQFGDTWETDWNNKLNIQFPIKLFKEKSTLVKIGGRYSRKEKERNNIFYIYTPLSGNTAVANLAVVPSFNGSDPNYLAGSQYQIDSFAQPIALGVLNLKDKTQFSEALSPADYLGQNYTAREKLYNAYIRIDQEITDKLSMIVGARFEATENYYKGNILRNSATLVGADDTTSRYNNLLPSINLKYQASKDLIFRAAVTTALARPAYFDLVPFMNVNSVDQSITRGNATLKATNSVNYDFMVEKYYKNVGLISGGVFYKTLNNFFYTFYTNNYSTTDYANEILPIVGGINPIGATDKWRYSQARNGNKARFYGVELSIQRQLDFLPGIWKGFGIYLNYTYTKSTADGITSSDGASVRTNLSLPGTAPHTFNGSLSYENKKLVARVAANYTAAYIDVIGANSFEDSYYDKQFFVDANASYAVTPKLRFFSEINNITNQPLRYYQGVKERTMQVEYYNIRWNMGLKFDLF
ncbi:MAG: TonB-dependent receptor [Sphingobacteriia bacterium]|nr:MAG: TonB-dependent receptor [Sphingobacteriia bacterium]TAG29800.1 MAG: TonB-dependent receptor [Sphingobacteriia bacterium]